MGDLNYKSPDWNNITTNTNDTRLQRDADRHPDLSIMGLNSTHYTHTDHRLDVLDIAVLSKHTFPVEMYAVQEGSSDHNVIIIEIGQPDQTENNGKTIRKKVD